MRADGDDTQKEGKIGVAKLRSSRAPTTRRDLAQGDFNLAFRNSTSLDVGGRGSRCISARKICNAAASNTPKLKFWQPS